MRLRFDLRFAIDEYESKTGLRLTYDALSVATGISTDSLKSIATRNNYNVSLKNISLICEFLNLDPLEYFIWEEEH